MVQRDYNVQYQISHVNDSRLRLNLDILPMPKGRGFLQRDGHARPREDSNITTIFSHSLNDLLFSLHISMRNHPTENNCTTFVIGDLMVKASDYTTMIAQIKKKYNNYFKILSPYNPMPKGRCFTASKIKTSFECHCVHNTTMVLKVKHIFYLTMKKNTV